MAWPGCSILALSASILAVLLSLPGRCGAAPPLPSDPPPPPPPAGPYNTLTGAAPIIVARGGASCQYPDMTYPAYELAIQNGADYLHCGVVMTKDGSAVCRPGLDLGNNTNVRDLKKRASRNFKTYTIDGVNVTGLFSVDFNLTEILRMRGVQPLTYRTEGFDRDYRPMTPKQVFDTARKARPRKGVYLELLSPSFFESQGLNSSTFILELLKQFNYTSADSPVFIATTEISALTYLRSQTSVPLLLKLLGANNTDQSAKEPTTGQPYSYFVESTVGLTAVKAVANGVLLPKGYVYPGSAPSANFTSTTVLYSVHTAGLSSHVYGFANDDPDFSFGWGGDPINEYVAFLNANYSFQFGSADAILTDNPATAALALNCYQQEPTISPLEAGYEPLPTDRPLILGEANGQLPAQTAASYFRAILEGVDVISCTVQMTLDGVPICRRSPDLISNTDILDVFPDFPTTSYPDIQDGPGIFSFDLNSTFILNNLTAKQSQSFRPAVGGLPVITLAEFLEIRAQANRTVGAILRLEFPTFLLERNLSVVEAALAALEEFEFRGTDTIFLECFESGVLQSLRSRTELPLVQRLDSVPAVDPTTGATYVEYASEEGLSFIASYASHISAYKSVISPDYYDPVNTSLNFFLLNATDVVSLAQATGLKVFVYDLAAEPLTMVWDFLADPVIELDFYVRSQKVDGVFHQFPATAASYFNTGYNLYGNVCYKQRASRRPYNITTVTPGEYLRQAQQGPVASPPEPPTAPEPSTAPEPAQAPPEGLPVDRSGNPPPPVPVALTAPSTSPPLEPGPPESSLPPGVSLGSPSPPPPEGAVTVPRPPPPPVPSSNRSQRSAHLLPAIYVLGIVFLSMLVLCQ